MDCRHLLLDLSDSLAWVEVLGACLGAIHDGVAAVKLEEKRIQERGEGGEEEAITKTSSYTPLVEEAKTDLTNSYPYLESVVKILKTLLGLVVAGISNPEN